MKARECLQKTHGILALAETTDRKDDGHVGRDRQPHTRSQPVADLEAVGIHAHAGHLNPLGS